MTLRQTHTFATLAVTPAVYDEIKGKLEAAGYQDAFVTVEQPEDGYVGNPAIDMHGIGLVKGEDEPSEENRDVDTVYPRDEYHEDHGPVLWWAVPVQEPPYVGTNLDDDFPDYVTHWSRLHIPPSLARG